MREWHGTGRYPIELEKDREITWDNQQGNRESHGFRCLSLPCELTNSSATYCKVGCHHGRLYCSPTAISLPSMKEMIKIEVDFMLRNNRGEKWLYWRSGCTVWSSRVLLDGENVSKSRYCHQSEPLHFLIVTISFRTKYVSLNNVVKTQVGFGFDISLKSR